MSQLGDDNELYNISGDTYKGVPQKVPVLGSNSKQSRSLLKYTPLSSYNASPKSHYNKIF